MKKYKTTIWPLALLMLIGIIGFGIAAYFEANNLMRLIKGVGIFAFVPLLAVFAFGWLTYEKITDDKRLKHVVFGLFRRYDFPSYKR